jgi:hypothetical protein
MTKHEILKEQILGIAQGLPSDQIDQIAEALGDLARDRSNSILDSFTENEMDGLFEAYQLAVHDTQFVTISQLVNFKIAVTASESDDNCWNPVFTVLFDDLNEETHAEDLVDQLALRRGPACKSMWEEKLDRIQHLNSIVDALSKKYCLPKEIIFNRCRDKLDSI